MTLVEQDGRYRAADCDSHGGAFPKISIFVQFVLGAQCCGCGMLAEGEKSAP